MHISWTVRLIYFVGGMIAGALCITLLTINIIATDPKTGNDYTVYHGPFAGRCVATKNLDVK